ncbi:MAG: hypothetical protein MN733_14585 [Nitrososphaera sp.]|nr:hypothetical protein [Nitrososphaera sp.]
MPMQAIFSVIKRNGISILLAGLLVSALSFAALVFTSKNFKVSLDFLVVQTLASQDFYAQFKSAEYIGKVLSESVYSERFVDALIATGKVDVNSLPSDKKERLKQWSETVKVQRNLDVGMLGVTVLANDQKQGLRIAEALTQVLTEQNGLFRGGDEKSVEVRVLSGPILERNPSVKELILATMGGLVLGIVLMLLWVVLRVEGVMLQSQRSREEFASSSVVENEFDHLQDARVVFQER